MLRIRYTSLEQEAEARVQLAQHRAKAQQATALQHKLTDLRLVRAMMQVALA